jgi:hypothetical protein
MRNVGFLKAGLSLFLLAVSSWCVPSAFATSVPTTTTLAFTSGSNPVTSVTSGSRVTLTAAVTSGSTKVTVGQVNFCHGHPPSRDRSIDQSRDSHHQVQAGRRESQLQGRLCRDAEWRHSLRGQQFWPNRAVGYGWLSNDNLNCAERKCWRLYANSDGIWVRKRRAHGDGIFPRCQQ